MVRDAANSTARGTPSRRRQIAAAASRSSDLTVAPSVAAAALVTIEQLAPTLREFGLIGDPVDVAADADPGRDSGEPG